MRCCGRGSATSATWCWWRANGTSARSGSMSRCGPIRGSEASAPCARTSRRQALGQRISSGAVLRQIGHLARGRRCIPAAPTRFACMPRYAGHPVAGDEKYGDAEFNTRMRELGLTQNVPPCAQHELRVAPGRYLQCERAASPRSSPPSSTGWADKRQGSRKPARRSAQASQISGRPMMAVGSRLSMLSKSEMPRPSARKPPAQSNGRSRST